MTQSTKASAKTLSSLQLITPAKASLMIKADRFLCQRNLRHTHVDKLAALMEAGQFMAGTQIHFAVLNKHNNCVNGQHTLHAIVSSGIAQTLSVLITVAESADEVATLYSSHDCHLSRTLADSAKAFGIETVLGISTRQINVANSGIRAIMNGFCNQKLSGRAVSSSNADRVIMLRNEYGPAVQSYFEAIKGAPKAYMKQLMHAAIVGVALITFKESPHKAKEFWSSLAHSGGLDNGDPRRTLMMWLISNTLTEQPHQARARAAEKAWNVFAVGGKMKRLLIDVSSTVNPVKV